MQSRMPSNNNKMPEQTISYMREFIAGAIALGLAVLGFNAKNVVKRLDKHDDKLEKKVGKEEHNSTVNAIRQEIKKGIEQTQATTDSQTREFRTFMNHMTTSMNHMTNRIDNVVDKDK